MELLIDMNIGDLWKLQQDLRKIDEFEGKLKETDIDLFQQYIEYFGDISGVIGNKLNELNKDKDDDD